jgi:hypothetical protein
VVGVAHTYPIGQLKDAADYVVAGLPELSFPLLVRLVDRNESHDSESS